MLLFPGDVESLLAHLAERLDLDSHLVERCRPHLESEAYQNLISAVTAELAKRLGQKASLSDQATSADWVEKIDWEAAGVAPKEAKALTNFIQVVLASSADLPATAKSGRAILLLTDVLLAELDKLPDLAQPGEVPADPDARPFFDELVKSLNALLPYEQRDFPTKMTPTQVQLLFPSLPEEAYYSVKILPPAGADPGHLEMGLHFGSGDMEKLVRHFKRKIPGLSHSLGGKEVIIEEKGGLLAILLYQPYQPAEKLSAFMTAATLVGLIGSIQERMPR
jgi:hypothetical protein